MFFGSFSWSFVYVSLPFHIQKISTLDEVATLRWTGWILGISPLATVVTAPWLGRIGGRDKSQDGVRIIQYLQGAAFFAMAMARTLPEIFVSRLLVGLMGAAPRSPSSARVGPTIQVRCAARWRPCSRP